MKRSYRWRDPADLTIRCAQCDRILGWFHSHRSAMIEDALKHNAQNAMRRGDVAEVARLVLRIKYSVDARAPRTIVLEGGGRSIRLRCNGERCTYERTPRPERFAEELRRASEMRLGSVTFR